MKRIPFIISIITLSFTLVACGDNVSATTTPEVSEEVKVKTEVVATPTTGSPDEGKETPVVEPTAELEPTEEVVEVPTPIPTEEPEPTEEVVEEVLPTPSVDIEDYLNDELGFDFIRFAKDIKCDKKHPCTCDLIGLQSMCFRMNGWIIQLYGDPRGYDGTIIATAQVADEYNNEIIHEWDIPLDLDEDDIITVNLPSRNLSNEYSLTAIKMIPYILEWCKENPYREGPPDVFKDQWEAY